MAPRGATAEDVYALRYGNCGEHKACHFRMLAAVLKCISTSAQQFHPVVYWFAQPESDVFFLSARSAGGGGILQSLPWLAYMDALVAC